MRIQAKWQVPIPPGFRVGKAASNTFDHDQGYRVTWISDRPGCQHTEARCLSSRTRLAASQISPDVDWVSAMADLEALLLRIYPDAVLAVQSTALELVLTHGNKIGFTEYAVVPNSAEQKSDRGLWAEKTTRQRPNELIKPAVRSCGPGVDCPHRIIRTLSQTGSTILIELGSFFACW